MNTICIPIALRLQALLRQCDALEARLRQTRTLGAHFLDPTFKGELCP